LLLDALPHHVDIVIDEPLTEELVWSTAEVSGWTPWDVVVRAGLGLGPPAGWDREGAPGTWSVDGTGLPRSWPSAEGNGCTVRGGGAPRRRPALVPYSMVSSGRITTAGSLSADAAWRFSAVLGREHDSVVWLDLRTASG